MSKEEKHRLFPHLALCKIGHHSITVSPYRRDNNVPLRVPGSSFTEQANEATILAGRDRLDITDVKFSEKAI